MTLANIPGMQQVIKKYLNVLAKVVIGNESCVSHFEPLE